MANPYLYTKRPTSRKDMITYRRTERTPTDATRQETHRFIAEGVRPDWWKTTSHDPHETPGVVRDWWKKDHTMITRGGLMDGSWVI